MIYGVFALGRFKQLREKNRATPNVARGSRAPTFKRSNHNRINATFQIKNVTRQRRNRALNNNTHDDDDNVTSVLCVFNNIHLLVVRRGRFQQLLGSGEVNTRVPASKLRV